LAAPEVPCRPLEQLAEGGRLVIPVGNDRDQQLQVITRVGGEFQARLSTHCRFVPLRGRHGFR
jgi:protein-L-isoaspartate(D-aspartate) O-methyltransferase